MAVAHTAPALLLVDDDAVFAGVLARSLERRDYRVEVAHTVAAALAEAARTSFDHVLLDLMLEEGSSLPRIPDLRAALPQAQIVVLTGYASIPTTVQAMKLGADNYLAKPVGVHEVLSVLSGKPHAAAAAVAKPLTLQRLEWEHLQRVLAEHEGNISAAAASLGMHRRTLQRKLGKRPGAE